LENNLSYSIISEVSSDMFFEQEMENSDITINTKYNFFIIFKLILIYLTMI